MVASCVEAAVGADVVKAIVGVVGASVLVACGVVVGGTVGVPVPSVGVIVKLGVGALVSVAVGIMVTVGVLVALGGTVVGVEDLVVCVQFSLANTVKPLEVVELLGVPQPPPHDKLSAVAISVSILIQPSCKYDSGMVLDCGKEIVVEVLVGIFLVIVSN